MYAPRYAVDHILVNKIYSIWVFDTCQTLHRIRNVVNNIIFKPVFEYYVNNIILKPIFEYSSHICYIYIFLLSSDLLQTLCLLWET